MEINNQKELNENMNEKHLVIKFNKPHIDDTDITHWQFECDTIKLYHFKNRQIYVPDNIRVIHLSYSYNCHINTKARPICWQCVLCTIDVFNNGCSFQDCSKCTANINDYHEKKGMGSFACRHCTILLKNTTNPNYQIIDGIKNTLIYA